MANKFKSYVDLMDWLKKHAEIAENVEYLVREDGSRFQISDKLDRLRMA